MQLPRSATPTIGSLPRPSWLATTERSRVIFRLEGGALKEAQDDATSLNILLSSHVEARGVVLRFFERAAFQPEDYSTTLCRCEPAWAWKTANGRRGDRRELHESPS